MKNGGGRPRRSSRRRIRGTAPAPNSPREIAVGVVMPRWIHSDGPSKSNVRDTYPAALSASSTIGARTYRSATLGQDGQQVAVWARSWPERSEHREHGGAAALLAGEGVEHLPVAVLV